MSPMVYQITAFSIIYLTVCSGADQRKHQRSVSLTFVRGINRLPVNSPHKGPVTRKMFPFDDVIRVHDDGFAPLDALTSAGAEIGEVQVR